MQQQLKNEELDLYRKYRVDGLYSYDIYENPNYRHIDEVLKRNDNVQLRHAEKLYELKSMIYSMDPPQFTSTLKSKIRTTSKN